MIILNFSHIEIAWYYYLLIGFLIGAYLHWLWFHHAIHWFVIKFLSGFSWMLKRTDPYYKEPKVEKAKTKEPSIIQGDRKDGIEVEEDEVQKWLKKNPELSVSER